MERFLDPAVWMEKRLAYTHSVATTSIGTAVCCAKTPPCHKIRAGGPGGCDVMSGSLQGWNQLLCFVPTVGYIVGLGDRHINNILIDEQTAELVHIDLGKAPHPAVC